LATSLSSYDPSPASELKAIRLYSVARLNSF